MRLGLMIALASAVPAAALAQTPAGDDETKPVTRSEIEARLEADYADLDADKDGKVTPEEINARLVKSAEAKVEVLKKERDAAFAKLDTNGDGNISRAEFDEKAKLPTIKEPDAKPFLAQFDADKDGGITKEEFRAPTLANFEKLDANKDGTVTPAEVKKGGTTGAAVTATPQTAKKKPSFKSTPPINR